ncbi:hypothetical protein LCGC14_1338680 [marine sediment metagenome]|uniref:Uncharacterized protein n=1 Tax=marine sediment metagenome TaxID=412755 RepID=A0A0F9L0N6_9ZZZZ
MCNITTIDRGERGRVTVEFDRRADIRATEVFVINQGPGDDPIEAGVSIICNDKGTIRNIDQLPMRKSKDILPEPLVDLKKEIREAWESVKAMSFFGGTCGKDVGSCRLGLQTCEIVKMDRLLKE